MILTTANNTGVLKDLQHEALEWGGSWSRESAHGAPSARWGSGRCPFPVPTGLAWARRRKKKEEFLTLWRCTRVWNVARVDCNTHTNTVSWSINTRLLATLPIYFCASLSDVNTKRLESILICLSEIGAARRGQCVSQRRQQTFIPLLIFILV